MRLTQSVRFPACIFTLVLLTTHIPSRAADFSWQRPHAFITNDGDLEWAPESFEYRTSGSVVYIDYENGDDSNSGTSKSSPLKHHPWDVNATGNAKSMSGAKTYVFKRGVIYRGTLVADESGQAGSPITLTSDPSWGTGEAGIYGSERITGGWKKCTTGDCPGIPDPGKVWYIDLPFAIVDNPYGSYPTYPKIYPEMVVEVTDTGLARINVARAPNWEITDPNHPRKDWWTVELVGRKTVKLPNTFGVTDASAWEGGTIWTGWGTGSGAGANMGTVNQGLIKSYSGGSVVIGGAKISNYCKYYIENLPHLLDAPNEFYCTPEVLPNPNRMYVRLRGDRDPNTATIEVGVRPDIIDIVDKSNIVISGLTFAVNNQPRPGNTPECVHFNTRDGGCQAIELSGRCSNIEIANCRFRHIVMGIAPRRDEASPPQTFDNIVVRDNDFAHIEDQSIAIGTKETGSLRNISVLRNRLRDCGSRQTCRSYSPIPAITLVNVTSAEVAGNMVHYTWGQGINYSAETGTTGKPGDQVKVLVHHNKVTTSLLGTNDWGGIEAWEDGPGFIWSNISGNPRGYRPFSGENVYNPWGGAIYVDHGNHQKVFNNIVWGVHNNPSKAAERNPCGLMQAVSERSFFANNTVYNFFDGQRSVGGKRGTYVGNLFSDITGRFETPYKVLTRVGYAKNVYHGSPEKFSSNGSTIGEFETNLSNGGALCSDAGIHSSSKVLVDPANGDFRPTGDAIGNGAKIFLPWNLAEIAGEWHFHKNEADVTTVYGWDAPSRSQAEDNHLKVQGVSASDFVMGALENWTEGALRFDGSSIHGTVTNNAAFDVSTGGLILEAYVKTSAGGPIMSKGGSSGYMLEVSSSGNARLTLKGYTLSSSSPVNDDQWHHILAELDRSAGKATLYVDGSADDGTASGSIPSSLASSASFYVGRNGSSYFTGDIDFARVAKGSFADGATSFEELYAWEFDGPALRDFAGVKVDGARDGGALQYAENVGANPVVRKIKPAAMLGVRYLSGARTLLVDVRGNLAAKTPIRCSVVNAAGQAVWDRKTTLDKLGASGRIGIDANAWASGVYLVRVTTPNNVHVKRFSMYR